MMDSLLKCDLFFLYSFDPIGLVIRLAILPISVWGAHCGEAEMKTRFQGAEAGTSCTRMQSERNTHIKTS